MYQADTPYFKDHDSSGGKRHESANFPTKDSVLGFSIDKKENGNLLAKSNHQGNSSKEHSHSDSQDQSELNVDYNSRLFDKSAISNMTPGKNHSSSNRGSANEGNEHDRSEHDRSGSALGKSA